MNNWDIEFDPKKQNQEDPIEREKRLQLSRDFVETFNTIHGKRVLEYLQEHTLDLPTWFQGQPETGAIFREGQNSIVREIVMRIKKAKEEA